MPFNRHCTTAETSECDTPLDRVFWSLSKSVQVSVIGLPSLPH